MQQIYKFEQVFVSTDGFFALLKWLDKLNVSKLPLLLRIEFFLVRIANP
jgi:hypothetical protein